MRVSDQLRAAKVLAVEHNTTGTFARDRAGVAVSYFGGIDRDACSFCAWGACAWVEGVTPGDSKLVKRLDTAGIELFGYLTADVNDQKGVQAVAQMFNRAIREAEKEEGSTCG